MLYIADEKVAGPALVAAYVLESKAAILPRVVIAEELCHFVPHGSHYRLSDGPAVASPAWAYALRDRDGAVFCNYLRCDNSVQLQTALSRMMKHKTFVIDRLASAQNLHIYAKYEWAARYHNFMVRHLLDYAKYEEVGPQHLPTDGAVIPGFHGFAEEGFSVLAAN